MASPDRSIDVIDSPEKRPSDGMITTLPVSFSALAVLLASPSSYQSEYAGMKLSVLRNTLPFVRSKACVIENKLVGSFELAQCDLVVSVYHRCRHLRIINARANGAEPLQYLRTSPQSTTSNSSEILLFMLTLIAETWIRREPWRMPFGPKRALEHFSRVSRVR